MSNYAIVENNEIVGVYWNLPTNWKNISNFFALQDKEEHKDFLKTLGWYKVQKVTPTYDPTRQKLEGSRHWYDATTDTVYEEDLVVDVEQVFPEHSSFLTEEEIEQQRLANLATRWAEVRIERDKKMQEFEWRYVRYERQVRLNITPTDNINDLDNYMQTLADITQQSDPYNIVWPNF
jgi:hypothetical protein